MIDLWEVRYQDPETKVREVATVYAYPSGGVGVTVSDPDLADAMGATRSIVEGITAGEAEILAGKLADMICYLTRGQMSHSQVYGTDPESV